MSDPTGSPTPPPFPSAKSIWLLLIIICSTIVSVFAVVILRFLGADLVDAVYAGGAAWVAAAGLGVAFYRFLH